MTLLKKSNLQAEVHLSQCRNKRPQVQQVLQIKLFGLIWNNQYFTFPTSYLLNLTRRYFRLWWLAHGPCDFSVSSKSKPLFLNWPYRENFNNLTDMACTSTSTQNKPFLQDGLKHVLNLNQTQPSSTALSSSPALRSLVTTWDPRVAVQCSVVTQKTFRCTMRLQPGQCHCHSFKHFEATLSQSAERESDVMNRCKTQQDELFQTPTERRSKVKN